MGLAVWPYISDIIAKRKNVVHAYIRFLNFTHFQQIKLREDTSWNYSYYPVVFNSEAVLQKVQDELNKEDILPRRYFYPSLNKLSYLNKMNTCDVSEQVAGRILCLPIYHALSEKEVQLIANIVNIHCG